ncbi:uncharacterized protein LOC124115812 [Haliotis rufescens]|uniref:uncharacterized protein LOC124115812 n=1 Tax=Haliotis rufescens TaxID=6454 RepID=UPI001EB01324|nr:uncharacterized protein LOC124115812 [Haliotis rufescens]
MKEVILGLLPLLLAVVLVDAMSPPPLPCTDFLPNCDSYADSACTGTYESWARVKCARRCGFCGSPPPASPPPLCKDHLDNCNQFQADTCTNSFYRKWAEDNCRKSCGFCGSTTPGVPTPPMPTRHF